MSGSVVFENHTSESKDSVTTAIVANFSNGRLKLESESSSNVRFGYFCNSGKNIAARNDKLLVAETDRMQYIGQNFGCDASAAPSMCKYMLGVFDKRTSKVRLIDASMFHLRPSLDDSDLSDDESAKKKQEDETDDKLSFADKQARLILQFGTAKGKRAVKSRQRNQVDAKQLELALESMAKESVTSAAVTEEVAVAAPTVIPPHNKDALRPEDVYLPEDLIKPEEMLALVGPATVFLNASSRTIDEWRENSTYPGYVVNQLSVLPVQSDVRRQRACQLVYWCYLHRLLHAGNKPNVGMLLKDTPLVVRQTLLERFTIMHSGTNEKAAYLIPSRLKDLLRSHMLVLCLMLEEFSLEYTALQRDLDVSLPQLEKCFQALGCKTSRPIAKEAVGSRSSKSFKAALVVPLKFPVYKARAGRR